MNQSRSKGLYIKYELPDDPDLLLAARSLEANALNQRTVVLQTCLHSNDKSSCERDAEIAFREKISSIPGTRFILCFQLDNEFHDLVNLTPQQAIDPQLNAVFHHLSPNVASPMGLVIIWNQSDPPSGRLDYPLEYLVLHEDIDPTKLDSSIFYKSYQYSALGAAIGNMIYKVVNDLDPV